MQNITGMCPAFPGFKAVYVMAPSHQAQSGRVEKKCYLELPIALFAVINFVSLKPAVIDEFGKLRLIPDNYEGHVFYGVRAPSDTDEVVADWAKSHYDKLYDKWLGDVPTPDDLASSFE